VLLANFEDRVNYDCHHQVLWFMGVCQDALWLAQHWTVFTVNDGQDPCRPVLHLSLFRWLSGGPLNRSSHRDHLCLLFKPPSSLQSSLPTWHPHQPDKCLFARDSVNFVYNDLTTSPSLPYLLVSKWHKNFFFFLTIVIPPSLAWFYWAGVPLTPEGKMKFFWVLSGKNVYKI